MGAVIGEDLHSGSGNRQKNYFKRLWGRELSIEGTGVPVEDVQVEAVVQLAVHDLRRISKRKSTSFKSTKVLTSSNKSVGDPKTKVVVLNPSF